MRYLIKYTYTGEYVAKDGATKSARRALVFPTFTAANIFLQQVPGRCKYVIIEKKQ